MKIKTYMYTFSLKSMLQKIFKKGFW